MKTMVMATLLTISVVIATPVYSASPADDLGVCLVDSLNGKERKALAKWIFFAIAAHPDINSYSNASSDDIQKSDVYIGKLITRLLTENCPGELRKANAADPMAIQNAFELVGKVAMQELMTDENVMRSITNYANYVDQEKLQTVILGK